MPRPLTIPDDELFARISRTFRDVGYDGASIAILSEATGLKRASLYHRFPDGKAQMAGEVLRRAHDWMEENVLAPLRSDRPVPERIGTMCAALSTFYEGGRRACLLNLMSAPVGEDGRFSEAVSKTMSAWIEALAEAYREAGLSDPEDEATRALVLIQGGLVVARGMGSTEPFEQALDSLRVQLDP